MVRILKYSAVVVGVLSAVLALFLLFLMMFAINIPDQPIPRDQVLKDVKYLSAAKDASGELTKLFTRVMPPSISVSVGKNGKVVWQEAIGYADIQADQAAGIDTRYRIGGVSKPLTAVVAAKLVEAGDLDLDASVYRYVPDFPRKQFDFSVRQLGGHLAGIRHYSAVIPYVLNDEMMLNRQFDSVSEALSVFKDDALLFEPGADFTYSSYGFNLLSAVLEGASEKLFTDLMQEQLLARVGMHRTEAEGAGIDDHAFYYIGVRGRLFPAPEINNSVKWGSGGYLSTPTDLVRFGNAVLDGKFLNGDSFVLLSTPQRLDNGKVNPQKYSFGFRVGTTSAGNRVIHHGGSSVGGAAFLVLFPEHRVVAAMTINMSMIDEYRTSLIKIAEMFLND